MVSAFIHSISYYLPQNCLTNEKIASDFPEWSIEKISSKTGIINRHISSDDEYASDMGVKAAEKLFSENNIDRNSVDFILFCTQSPDYFLPTTACLIQDRLNLKKSIGALDFNLGCSGYVYGLSLAKGLIIGGMAKNILLITSETYSKFIHNKDKSNKTIFGDAAAATLITSEFGKFEIGDFDFGTDGSGGENLIVKRGGIKYPNLVSASEEIIDEFGNTHLENNLYMNGTEIFNFTNETVPISLENLLKKAKLDFNEIDLFVFHQANQYVLNHLRKKLNIPESKFAIEMGDIGNTVSSTIPIALKNWVDKNSLHSIQNIILMGFGVGYSWASCTLKKRD